MGSRGQVDLKSQCAARAVASMFMVRSPPLARALADELAEILSEAGEPDAGAVSVVEADERRDLWQIEAYYEEAPTGAALAGLGLDAARFSIERLPDIDWVARSLDNLAPVRAGRFIVHGSHDRNLPPGGLAIEIAAGTAFGTGHHATTRGCLLAADRWLKRRRPRRILDLSSGTGVFAIAAAKVARAPALAVDIDPEAVRVTRANARLNGAADLVKAASRLPVRARSTRFGALHSPSPRRGACPGPDPGLGSNRTLVVHRSALLDASLRWHEVGWRRFELIGIRPRGPAAQRYDLIFANILAGPLVDLAPDLAPRLVRGGALILSGLTIDQERQVAAAYRCRGLRLEWRLRLDNWSILVFTRPAALRKSKGPGWL